MLILDVVALTIVGLLAGVELSIAAFIHPALCRLPDAVHFAAANAFAKLLGRVMPVWYPLAAVLTAALTFLAYRSSGTWPVLLVLSMGVWVLTVVFSLTALVPINNRIASWTDETKPADWKRFRSRWDQLHRWRVLVLTVAFAFLAAGLLRSR